MQGGAEEVLKSYRGKPQRLETGFMQGGIDLLYTITGIVIVEI